MSFEVFVWHDGGWKSTGKRFKTHKSAKDFGEHSYTDESKYPAGFEVRESAEEPNQGS